jgi:hypothetical protein
MASIYRLAHLVIGGEQPSPDDTRLALTYYEQALDIFDTKLGRDHPDTIDCLFRFACDLTHASQPQRAKPYLERLLCHFESKQKHELDRSITRRVADIMICLDAGCNPVSGDEILSFEARLHALFRRASGKVERPPNNCEVVAVTHCKAFPIAMLDRIGGFAGPATPRESCERTRRSFLEVTSNPKRLAIPRAP